MPIFFLSCMYPEGKFTIGMYSSSSFSSFSCSWIPSSLADHKVHLFTWNVLPAWSPISFLELSRFLLWFGKNQCASLLPILQNFPIGVMQGKWIKCYGWLIEWLPLLQLKDIHLCPFSCSESTIFVLEPQSAHQGITDDLCL